MSASLIFQAVAKLRANAVPGDNLNAVIHPQVAFDLKSGLQIHLLTQIQVLVMKH